MAPLALLPGSGIGFIRLGAALYDVLTALKADSKAFPKLDVSYSPTEPLVLPVVVDLPENGFRLRFDGPLQRLRLIEVLDLTKGLFTVKNEPLLQPCDRLDASTLMYRRVYQLFGASYPGEYIAKAGSSSGIYVVSYPGMALSFSLDTSKWSAQTDHAKMLADAGATVSSLAIFEGKSWAEARKEIYTCKSAYPQSLFPITRQKEGLPDEIESIQIRSSQLLHFSRRSSCPISITLGETTAQDLINDFGPPDAVHKRQGEMSDATIRPSRMTRRRSSGVVPRSFGSTSSSISSTNTETYDDDFEEDDGIDGPDVVHQEEQYYCYFQHGFDILLGQSRAQQVATRIILHGNVPGSFEFNRHRRSRWSIEHVQGSITSESHFGEIHQHLIKAFKNAWPQKEMEEGMVIVRDWAGDSPSGSAILIGDGDEEEEEEAWSRVGEQWLKNTQLYKFPGLIFEVMHNGAISALTVYPHPV